MPLLYICATSASSWSFTESPHFPDAPIFLFLVASPNRHARPQPLLLMVFGLAAYLFTCRSGTGPNAEFDDPGTKLLADIGRPASLRHVPPPESNLPVVSQTAL